MTLESTLEHTGCACLLNLGAFPVKRGQDSEPDREVLWGKGRHFWIEFKKPGGGRIRPGQATYAKYLLGIGDEVHFINDMQQLRNVIDRWISTHGMPTASRDRVFNP